MYTLPIRKERIGLTKQSATLSSLLRHNKNHFDIKEVHLMASSCSSAHSIFEKNELREWGALLTGVHHSLPAAAISHADHPDSRKRQWSIGDIKTTTKERRFHFFFLSSSSFFSQMCLPNNKDDVIAHSNFPFERLWQDEWLVSSHRLTMAFHFRAFLFTKRQNY